MMDGIPVSGLPLDSAFDEKIVAILKNTAAPGVLMAAFAYCPRRRRTILLANKAYGYQDATRTAPLLPTMPEGILSNAKPITAVAVMLLVQDGRLSVDTQVLPFLGLDSPKDRRWMHLTVRHLMQHLGGVPREPRWPEADELAVLAKEGKADVIDGRITMRSLVRLQLASDLTSDPREGVFGYSNLGYQILGRVIEKASGQRYDRFVKQQVLKPLRAQHAVNMGYVLRTETGKKDGFYSPIWNHYDAAAKTYTPTAYAYSPEPYRPWGASDASGAWWMPTADFAAFVSGWRRLLTRRTLELMEPKGRVIDAGKETENAYSGWVWVRNRGADSGVYHGGGFNGATSNGLSRCLDGGDGWGIVWLANSDNSEVGPQVERALYEVKDSLSADPSVCSDVWAEYGYAMA